MANLEENTSLITALTEIEKKVGQAEIDRNTLKTNLSNKGVDVSGTDKMQGLVEKVNELENNPFFANLDLIKNPYIQIELDIKLKDMLARSLCYKKGNNVYYVGGSLPGSNNTNKYGYGFNLDTFEELPQISNSGFGSKVVLPLYTELTDNDNFAYYHGDISTSLSIYDVTTMTASYKSLPFTFPSCEKIGNYIYTFGGRDYRDDTQYTSVYKLDLQTYTSTYITKLPRYTENAVTVLVGNEVYIFPSTYSKKMMKYDLLTDTATELDITGTNKTIKKATNCRVLHYKHYFYILNGGILYRFDDLNNNLEEFTLTKSTNYDFSFKHNNNIFYCGGTKDANSNTSNITMLGIRK